MLLSQISRNLYPVLFVLLFMRVNATCLPVQKPILHGEALHLQPPVSSTKPKDGTYTYKILFAEWGGKYMGATCTVIVLGDTIKVIHDGTGNLTGKKGDILEQGIIMRHIKTGKWIIGKKDNDKAAEEIGGCSDGPAIIDFDKKSYWTC